MNILIGQNCLNKKTAFEYVVKRGRNNYLIQAAFFKQNFLIEKNSETFKYKESMTEKHNKTEE